MLWILDDVSGWLGLISGEGDAACWCLLCSELLNSCVSFNEFPNSMFCIGLLRTGVVGLLGGVVVVVWVGGRQVWLDEW